VSLYDQREAQARPIAAAAVVSEPCITTVVGGTGLILYFEVATLTLRLH
jgi:Mg/Co/Ni transporter MgtE